MCYHSEYETEARVLHQMPAMIQTKFDRCNAIVVVPTNIVDNFAGNGPTTFYEHVMVPSQARDSAIAGVSLPGNACEPNTCEAQRQMARCKVSVNCQWKKVAFMK